MKPSILASGAALAVITLSLACDGGSASPTAPPPPLTGGTGQPGVPVVGQISPSAGRADGNTRVRISGSQFEPGATVTLDGAATDVDVIDSAVMYATTPAHAAGTVDIVVTNPNGRAGTLKSGYTYVTYPTGVRPALTSISPDHGIIGGGTSVQISGIGLHAGTHLLLGGILTRATVHDGTMYFETPAHAPGPVDVVVNNPDGESATLVRGFAFVAPDSLALDGEWVGNSGSHGELDFRFTVEGGTVTRASCDGLEHAFSPPASTRSGEFSARVDGSVILSGKFFSSLYGIGEGQGPCGPRWEAWKAAAQRGAW